MKKNSPKLIQSVQRSIDILNCFELSHHNLTINEISKKIQVNVNTVRGLVNTLVANDLLVHDINTNMYHLGYYFINKAQIIQSEIDTYINLCKSHIDKLSNKYHISASIQIVQQNEIFSVYCAYPNKTAYYIILSTYTDLPKHATSSGQLFLAYNPIYQSEDYLSQLSLHPFTLNTITDYKKLKQRINIVQKEGYAQEIEEFALDVGSIAVPIFEPYQKKLIMTISCTFFVKTLDDIKKPILIDLKKISTFVTNKLRINTNTLKYIK